MKKSELKQIIKLVLLNTLQTYKYKMYDELPYDFDLLYDIKIYGLLPRIYKQAKRLRDFKTVKGLLSLMKQHHINIYDILEVLE